MDKLEKLGRVRHSMAARVAAVSIALAFPVSFFLATSAGAVTTPTITKAATTVETAAKTGLSHGISVAVIVFGIIFAFTVILLLVRKAKRA